MVRKTVVNILVLPVLVALLCVGPAFAQEPPPLTPQAILGNAITYQGHLEDGNGPANGTYDFEFKLYDGANPASATQQGSTVVAQDVAVADGNFTVSLDFGPSPFNGQALWLQVGVRPGTSTGAFTALAPLTALTAAPFALTLQPGASINQDRPSGNTLSVSNGVPGGLWMLGKTAISAWTSDGNALWGAAGTGSGVYGIHSAETGHLPGVGGLTHSTETQAAGVLGRASALEPTGDTAGVRGENQSINGKGYGVYGSHDGSGSGVHGTSQAGDGVYGISQTWNGVYGYSEGSPDVAVYPHGGVYGYGNDDVTGVVALSETGNPIAAYRPGPAPFYFPIRVFYVNNDGNVRAAGSFTGGGADFAEMLPAQEGLEPGDLLAIGPDGTLVKAVGAYSTAVAGIYSTQPGYVGGYDEEGAENEIPLAIMGVVPTKASAENGAILPGDLLTTSDTPGHVMKATDRDLMLGAVVGKALSGLESGTGTITVLVTLQ